MRTSLLAASLLLCVAVAPVGGALAQSTAAPSNRVVATVNGETITEADVALAMEDLQTQSPNLPPDRLQGIATDFLIEVKLAAQAAKAEKFEETDDYKRKLAYARERILMERLLSKSSAAATTDAAVKAFYDEQVKQLKPVEEVRARHILVPTEDEAKAIAERLKAGEDFAKLASELSKDPGSGKQGGDLGFFSKEQMVPEFSETAYSLKPGDTSAPVKSQFGWHIIKLEERRTRPIPAFADVKDRLAEALARKAQSDVIAELRKTAKIEKTPAPAEKK